MDYDRIVESSLNFFSLKKFVWFLVLFWLAFPVLVFVPWAFEKNYFPFTLEPLILLMFNLMYVVLFIGFISLLQHCFNSKKLPFTEINYKNIFYTIPLIFLEFWHIFVWNLHKPFRLTQILLIFGSVLLYFYNLFFPTPLISSAFTIFILFYTILIIHNFIRLIFTVPLFFINGEKFSLIPKKSWALTHKKFNEVFISLVLICGVLLLIFIIVSTIFSFFSFFILNLIFLPRIASELALRSGVLFAFAPILLAYYSSFTELFDQLLKEQNSSNKIKFILSKKVLSNNNLNKINNLNKKIVKKKLKKKK